MPTPNDPKSEYVGLMGSHLGPLCYELREEVDWLQNKWTEFNELFGSGEERIELLNSVASNFFYFLHKMMFEDAMLHLCRVTDPPETRVHVAGRIEIRKNLTVMALPKEISDLAFREQVRSRAQQSKTKCEFARRVRNRMLAHADLESLQQGASGPQIVRPQIDEALRSLRALIWFVEEHYGCPPSVLLKDPFGAQSLIFYLEEAARKVDLA